MDFFSKVVAYFSNRTERKSASMAENVKNPKILKDDRGMAIDYFAQMNDCKVAVPALLERFEFSLEHGINDTREKEKCMDAIIKYEKEALPFVSEHLKKTSRIAWPIKMLSKISDDEHVIAALKSCLDFSDVAFDQDKVDKNYDILCYLADYQLPGYSEKIAHFLSAHDERVRYAAVELLCLQNDENVPSIVEKFLSDDSNENTRLRKAVAMTFINRNWAIHNLDAYKQKPVPGLSLTSQMTLSVIK